MNGVEAPLRLTGVHLQPYNELVRPGRIWKISKYFLRRWTPYLPASYVWLVIGARQESYFNGNRPWFTAYDANLAAAAGVHVRSFRRSAKKEIAEGEGPLATFIHKTGDPAYVTGQPVPKQEETRYEVRLDDPLTPADAAHLAFWLRRQAPAHVTPQTVADLLAEARRERPQALRAALHAEEIDPDTNADPDAPQLLTVADVVAHTFPGVAPAPAWREAADRLHTHIVEPHLCHLETQYLRHKWLGDLGPGPLLLFVTLRSLCYHNPQTGEMRDQAALLSGELEQLFQKSSVTLRAWFSRLNELLGHSHVHGPFIETLSSRKLPTQQVETTYRLNLLTPLHPDDLAQYRALVTRQDGVDKDLSATSQQGEQSSVSHVAGGPENFVSHAAEGDERNGSHGAGGEQSFVSGSQKKWQPYKYYKDLLAALEPHYKALLFESTKQQQQAWKIDDSNALQPFAAAAFGSLKGLLSHFGVQGKMRRRLQQSGLSLEAITAWYLYAEREPGLDYPERYMMKQVAAGEAPPSQFLHLAQMSWEQWRTYAAANHVRPWLDGQTMEALFTSSGYCAWCEIYGEVKVDRLPLGVGEGLEALARSFAEAKPTAQSAGDVQGAPSAGEDAAHWQAALDELALQMTRATFNSWLRDATFLRRDGGQDGDTFVIAVRNDAARDWLANRMQAVIERTLSAVVGEAVRVAFAIGEQEYTNR